MFPRIEFLRQQFFLNRPSVCLEAALAKTRVFRETEGEALILRRAKSFRETCRTKTITIQPQELIVGNAGAKARQACITPELSNNWFVLELETMRDRPQDPYDITEEQKAQYREIIHPYWVGKSLRDIWEKQVPEDTMAIIRIGGVVDCGVKVESTPSELTPNFRDHLFVKGYSGIRREAEAALAALDLTDVRNLERRDFWRAAAITCEGMETLAARYAEKAGELAAAIAAAAYPAAVHLRRGDYCRPENEILQVCTPAYYARAAAAVKAAHPDATLFVFSDDVDWAKQNLNTADLPAVFAPRGSAVGDMALMEQCRGFVLSNSTYSWWAQYLAKTSDKLVLAPEKWYAHTKKSALYLPDWQLIETD